MDLRTQEQNGGVLRGSASLPHCSAEAGNTQRSFATEAQGHIWNFKIIPLCFTNQGVGVLEWLPQKIKIVPNSVVCDPLSWQCRNAHSKYFPLLARLYPLRGYFLV